MKFIILAICVAITFVNAQIRPLLSTRDRDAVILKQRFEPNPDGSYVYSYETTNGISAQQQGYIKNRGTTLEAQVCISIVFALCSQGSTTSKDMKTVYFYN